uniref:VWFC domain-containing protein n=1 Tax=Anopheles dirus TaxID=7168 RepID=A0A182N3U3_9DIPT
MFPSVTADLQQRCQSVRCPTDCPSDSYLQYPDAGTAYNTQDEETDPADETLTPVEGADDEPRVKRAIATNTLLIHKPIQITPIFNPNALPIQQQHLRLRRHLNPAELVQAVSDGPALEELCCPRCVCAPCAEPQSCLPHYTSIVDVPPHLGRPGACCPQVHCQPAEPVSCYSSATHRWYRENETWNENPCTRCRCRAGERSCEVSACKPLDCEHKKELQDRCCPVCDEERSIFCREHINCDLSCRHGYERRGNCALCVCARKPAANVTTTTTTTTAATTTVSVTFDRTSEESVAQRSSYMDPAEVEADTIAPDETTKEASTVNNRRSEEGFFGTLSGLMTLVLVLVVILVAAFVAHLTLTMECVKKALKMLFSCNQISQSKSAYNRVASTVPVTVATNTNSTVTGTDTNTSSMA